MKLQIRQGTFETNSSSTHSLVVYKDEMINLPIHIDFELGLYEWDWAVEDFANYFYTAIYVSGESATQHLDMLVDYLNSRKIGFTMQTRRDIELEGLSKFDYGLNHNSVITSNNLESLLKKENWSVLDYLFSNSFIVTGNDNCDENEFLEEFLPDEQHQVWSMKHEINCIIETYGK